MSAPRQPAAELRGLLLVHGQPGPVSAWVRRGLVACEVVPQGEWTALRPVEATSRASAPYDDAVAVLLSRPVPSRLRPALGLFVVDGRAVVTAQAKGWRAGRRGLVWEPGVGLVRTGAWQLARPQDLVAAAAATGRGPAASVEVSAVVSERFGDAAGMLARLLGCLGLPGAELLAAGDGLRGAVVAPSAQAVSRFEDRMTEQARHRAELEEY